MALVLPLFAAPSRFCPHAEQEMKLPLSFTLLDQIKLNHFARHNTIDINFFCFELHIILKLFQCFDAPQKSLA